jgi:hypothetical protein
LKTAVLLVSVLSCLCSAQDGKPKSNPNRAAAILAVRGLRDAMIDRESFRINNAFIFRDDVSNFTYLCTEYRVKTTAGGYVIHHYVFQKGINATEFHDYHYYLSLPNRTKIEERDIAYDDLYTSTELCAAPTAVDKVDVADEVRATLKADRDKE